MLGWIDAITVKSRLCDTGLLCSHCFCVEWSGWCEIDQTDQRLPSLDNTPPPTHHHNHRPIIPTVVTVMLFTIMPMITRGRRRISLKRTLSPSLHANKGGEMVRVQLSVNIFHRQHLFHFPSRFFFFILRSYCSSFKFYTGMVFLRSVFRLFSDLIVIH